MNKLTKFLTLLSVVLITACTSTVAKRDPQYAAVRPVALPEAPRADGAIFNVSNNVSYFEDYRARRVGDILTVNLEEKTTAEKESATTVSKSNSNSVTTPTILGAGLQFDAPSFLPLDNKTDNNGEIALSSEHEFDGSGDSDQSNKLTGDITVSVVEVLPNGNLVIRGEKVVTIIFKIRHIIISVLEESLVREILMLIMRFHQNVLQMFICLMLVMVRLMMPM